MKDKISLLAIILLCSFSNTAPSAQPSKFNLYGLPLPLSSGPVEQDGAKSGSEARERGDKKRPRVDVPPCNIPSRVKPRELCTGYFAHLLDQPHYRPLYPIRWQDHAHSGETRKSRSVRPHSLPGSVTPICINPDYWCRRTPLSPQSHLLVSLVTKVCTSPDASESELRETRYAIFNCFTPSEGNLPHANLLINTTYGLMPLLTFAIRSPKDAILSSEIVTVIRILAKKSSDQMRTLALNDPVARNRIKANPRLSDFSLLKMTKICDCESSEEEE